MAGREPLLQSWCAVLVLSGRLQHAGIPGRVSPGCCRPPDPACARGAGRASAPAGRERGPALPSPPAPRPPRSPKSVSRGSAVRGAGPPPSPSECLCDSSRLKIPSPSAELPGASVAGFCAACARSAFPSGDVSLGLSDRPGTAAGEAGRRQGCSGEGCSSVPYRKGSVSFIDACCNLANSR